MEESIEQVLSTFQFSRERLNRVCSKKHISEIATKINRERLVEALCELGIGTKGSISSTGLLDHWVEEKGDDATYFNLVRAFHAKRSQDSIEAICRILRDPQALDSNELWHDVGVKQTLNATDKNVRVVMAGHLELDQIMDSEGFESTISQLHAQFSSMCDQLLLEIQKQVTMKELMEVVPTRILSDSLVTIDDDSPEEEGVGTLLVCLKARSTILDYNCIKQIIMKFGSMELKETLTSYACSANNFFSSSTVQQLASTCPPQTDLPTDFSEMRVQIARDPSKYKLDHLNSFRDRYCHKVNMVDVLTFTGVLLEAKCFNALWSLSTLHVANLVASVEQIDKEFLRSEDIVCITIDRQVFHQLVEATEDQGSPDQLSYAEGQSSDKINQSGELIIEGGVKVKLQGEKKPRICFTYSFSPFMDKAIKMDWKCISNEDVQSQHIRCHELQSGDNIRELFHQFKKAHSKALILINTQNNYSLNSEFVEELERGWYPIVVVTKDDGAALIQLIESHRDQVEAKIDAESMVMNLKEEEYDIIVKDSEVPSHKQEIPLDQRRRMQRKTKIPGSLYDEVVKYLPADESTSVIISSDAGRFAMIMNAFSIYERKAHGDIPKVIKKLEEHKEAQFSKEVPFFLLLTYRLHMMNELCKCNEVKSFMKSVIVDLEDIDPGSVADSVCSLVEMEEFKVNFPDQSLETILPQSVLRLLESASQRLMTESYKMGKTQTGMTPVCMPYKGFVYTRMFWISLMLKFREKRRSTRNIGDPWKTHLLYHKSNIKLFDATIDELDKGITFGQLLKLHTDVAFSYSHMLDLISCNEPRPITHIKNFFMHFSGRSILKKDIILGFLGDVRKIFKGWLECGIVRVVRISTEQTLLGTITEGISFVQFMMDICSHHNLQQSLIETECTEWLLLFLELIDFTDHRARAHLEQFLKSKSKAVKSCRQNIVNYVLKKTEESFPALTIQQFGSLYEAFKIYPNSSVENFLSRYIPSNDIDITEPTWRYFFGDVVSRFVGAQHHGFLFDFLNTVSVVYLDDKRSQEFVFHLLELRVPKLFAVDDEECDEGSKKEDIAIRDRFWKFLSDYITSNALKNTVVTQISRILNSIRGHDDDFQQLVLSVLKEELVPDVKVIKNLDRPNYFKVLDEVSNTICGEINSRSAKHKFCWSVVASFCSKLHLSSELHWVCSCSLKLSYIYIIYCKQHNIPENQRLLIDEGVDAIKHLHSADMRKYFHWIKGVQTHLRCLKEQFSAQTVNYDNILCYATNSAMLHKISVNLYATSLLVNSEELESAKRAFIQEYEALNHILLKSIPGKPDLGWCTFLSLLRKCGIILPQALQEKLHRYILFPGQEAHGEWEPLVGHIPSKESRLSPDVSLQLSKHVDLVNLGALLTELQVFYEPLRDHMTMLTFFHTSRCEIFDAHLFVQISDLVTSTDSSTSRQQSILDLLSEVQSNGEQTTEGGLSIEKLVTSLDNIRTLFSRIMEGKAKYSEIVAKGRLHVHDMNIKKEFKLLKKFSDLEQMSSSGLEGVRSMLEVFQYSTYVHHIDSVCTQYQLEGCLKDAKLSRLKELVGELQSEEAREALTPDAALEVMSQIKNELTLPDPKYLELFLVMQNSIEFYHFIQESHFDTESGKSMFQQQYQLVTAQLQHEEYNECVLNHLFAAFKLMIPFLNTNQSLSDLLDQVSKLDVTSGLLQLETVNNNIDLIRLWFSKTEGDTLENVAKDLKYIFETGEYIFVSASEGKSTEIILEHVPSSGDKKCWNNEQISDFVRKLGFLDQEKEEGKQIKRFLHVNEVAYKLLELYLKLRELGHHQYIQGDNAGPPLPCNCDPQVAETRVKEVENELVEWKEFLTKLHSEYSWLLFFRIPKLLKLYHLIMDSRDDKETKIVHEISFLCTNIAEERLRMKKKVEIVLACFEDLLVAMRTSPDTVKETGAPMDHDSESISVNISSPEIVDMFDAPTQPNGEMSSQQSRKIDSKKRSLNDSPVHVVGAFLGQLFQDHALPLGSSSSPLQTTLMRTKSGELITTIIGLYNAVPETIGVMLLPSRGIPESFDIVRCQSTTTDEELRLFLTRASQYPRVYVILEVNKLPYKVQEYLMQIHLKIQDKARKCRQQSYPVNQSKVNPPVIHFIETAPSVLREMPWVNLKEHKGPDYSFENARRVCQKQVVTTSDYKHIQLVYGYAGDGKTHYIRTQLALLDEYIMISVNEAFTPTKAISKLQKLSFDAKKCGMFFNFTMLPPGAMVDEKERVSYKELMETIGWFFFDLFILRYVEDPVSGESFRMPGGLQLCIYVEVPSRDSDITPEEALSQFHNDIPVLALIGTEYKVKPEVNYTVDEDVQLVCKYLNALRSGEIDRLCEDDDNPVKFSLNKNLSEEDCHKLLQLYMPEHIKKNKVTQRLFIKYMERRCKFLDNFPGYNYNNGYGEYKTNEHGQKRRTDTRHLGSTLMNTMLKEVGEFCDPALKDEWSQKPHQQLIYDFKDGCGSFGLISLHPEKLNDKEFDLIGVEIPSMIKLGDREILDEYLSRALSIQLDVKKRDGTETEIKYLSAIDDSAYVLTPDYAIKMLDIHERFMCGVPVIIEGETGVGKTALVEMLSKLWNQSILLELQKQVDRTIEFLKKIVSNIELIEGLDASTYQACIDVMGNITSNRGDDNVIDKSSLVLLCQLPCGSDNRLCTQLLEHLHPMRNDPTIALLTPKSEQNDITFEVLFDKAETEKRPEAVADLLHCILTAQPASTFHKISMHAAMTPRDIEEKLRSAFQQATVLKASYESSYRKESSNFVTPVVRTLAKESTGPLFHRTKFPLMYSARSLHEIPPLSSSSDTSDSDDSSTPPLQQHPSGASFEPNIPRPSSINLSAGAPAISTKLRALWPTPAIKMPFVTVFLDEINTSSCVGLLKELIVDRTLDGNPIPENIFIIAACNPHRGNSMATHMKNEEIWMRGSYYVRSLHPTLKFLMWDYGSLDEAQERDYISAKLKMLQKQISNVEVSSLTTLILVSQNCMRDYALEQLRQAKTKDPETERLIPTSANSCVSQRDIQRVFTLYQWLINYFEKFKPKRRGNIRRALFVSLGIVYYMRLNTTFRQKYLEKLNQQTGVAGDIKFSNALNEELDWFISKVQLPKGIAQTAALKENLFATVVCTVTHTPLIIVGAPGSSKTLSFNIAIASLKGAESKQNIFRDKDIFKYLDPHYYQCSRRTTSNEIETVFYRARNRQRSHVNFKLNSYCVVFMDEAGLPEESHESLKVLHYHLDKQEVSFVAITNHVLDAAKTNRAVSLFRPNFSNDDLETLAKGCLCSDSKNPPQNLEIDLKTIVKFCSPYTYLMKDDELAKFFGLRDFIHFVNYIRRKRDSDNMHDVSCKITPQLVLRSLERNFNGCKPKDFESICNKFLGAIDVVDEKSVARRGILDILKDSLKDCPQNQHELSDNEVRYKLIIDPSEDDSLVRLLFTFQVLLKTKTRMCVCSDFPGDSHLQKINAIAAIRHSAIEGHTVVMSQTDDIHESFYDLFNQRFRRIDDPKKGPRYYTNIAIGAHLKPSRVHHEFQCIVVVKKSEIEDTPAPFLNRFEKYLITHSNLLKTALSQMDPCFIEIIKAAKDKAQNFIDCISGDVSLYGFQKESLDSLVLTLLPPIGHEYKTMDVPVFSESDSTPEPDYLTKIIQQLVHALRYCIGLQIPPITAEELTLDAEHISQMIFDSQVSGTHIEPMNMESIYMAIRDTMAILHASSTYDQEFFSNLEEQHVLIITIIQQWLVRYFVKRLMQLMTPEALILNQKKIPHSYLANYLIYQHHFSLKDMITSTVAAMDSNSTSCLNKVLCFTRSSPLLHKLPAYFDSSSVKTDAKQAKDVQNNVFDKPEFVIVCKLSTIPSQSSIQRILTEFIQSDERKVCLIVINMQETSKRIVNHLRIMIEAAEDENTSKVFILLLHFPPAQFFSPCYPSLFLTGWNHCYLDAIAHNNVEGCVNIKDWFWQCCFPQNSDEYDSLTDALESLLPQAIPVLSSRVICGARPGGSFNAPMKSPDFHKLLGQLIDELSVGVKLCKRFRTYWTPPVMAEYLERAASFTKSHESTLNITDSIQTVFKTLFFDFLVYMISRINEHFNIDVLFDTGTPAVHKLFLEILEVFPVPNLSQVNVLSVNIPTPQPMSYAPSFPFFHFVSNMMDKLVDHCQEEVNKRIGTITDEGENIDNQNLESSHSKKLLMKHLFTEVCSRITKQENDSSKSAIVAVVSALSKDSDGLWSRYCNDFVLHKLKLEVAGDHSEGIAQRILTETLFHQVRRLSSLQKMVFLHTFLHINKLDFAKLAAVLRPLYICELIAKDSSKLQLQSTTSQSMQFFSTLSSMDFDAFLISIKQNLATFIIDALYSALEYSLLQSDDASDSDTTSFELWLKAYREVMSLTTLKKYIYETLSPDGKSVIEARLNILYAVYITITTGLEVNFMKGKQIFQILEHDCARLSNVVNVVVDVVFQLKFTPTLHLENKDIASLMERLFTHFFSPDRPDYNLNDVQWFLELANSQDQWNTMKEPVGAISLSLFKLYLGRILGSVPKDLEVNEEEALKFGPLLLYRKGPRLQIAKVLLEISSKLGKPGPYIPVFYKESPFLNQTSTSSSIMHQPLAHLYFLTVLEHLMSDPPAEIMRSAEFINELLSKTSDGEKLLLWIELQAIVQLIAQQLQYHLDPENTSKVGEFRLLKPFVNRLLNDTDIGGGTAGGHAMVVALHLFKTLKSSRKFRDTFVHIYKRTYCEVECLKPFYDELQNLKPSNAHLLPFMHLNNVDELGSLYRNVLEAMEEIAIGKPNAVSGLVNIAKQCCPLQATVCTDPAHNKYNFRMMIWLVSYYEFYDKKKPSKELCSAINEISSYIEEEGYVRIIQCFLDPTQMICRREAPNPVADNQPVIELTEGGGHRTIPRKGKKEDPLHNLFVCGKDKKHDQSDVDLLHSVANMIAMVMRCPARSNHLWYHLFAADELKNTYMTGFMYDSKISPDGLLYDCGVELSPEGKYGRQDYMKHAGRGTYNLHSLYLLLWANFSAFCVSLLTQSDSDHKLFGVIISDWISLRHYCVSQLRAIWMHMRNNLSLSEEERVFFLMMSMRRLHQVVTQPQRCSEIVDMLTVESVEEALKGVFNTKDELDDYEKIWHCGIYLPTWNELRYKFVEHSLSKLFTNLRHLELIYPQFPSEEDYLHRLLNSRNLQSSDEGQFTILSRFSMEWSRLQTGGLLLPYLVEFYQWLHTHLAHRITFEKAASLPIGRVIHLAAKRYNKDMGDYLRDLYERVKSGYNKYVEVIGGAIGAGACAAVKRGEKIYIISDEIPLLHFLTDIEEEEQGNDWLYTVIADIVLAHNATIDSVYSVIQTQKLKIQTHLMPDEPSWIYLDEVDKTTCIIGELTELHGINSFLQLIRSRYVTSLNDSGSSVAIHHPKEPTAKFQLAQLEQDIIATFIAGKPYIHNESPSQLRTLFKFKSSDKDTDGIHFNLVNLALDVNEMTEKLPEEYKTPVEETVQKQLEYQFHSADYHTMLQMITGLKTALGHLIKDEKPENQTISQFIRTIYGEIVEEDALLKQIGIDQLAPTQLACMKDLPLRSIHSCLIMFTEWINIGLYDFCTLPFSLKVHMSDVDKEFIERNLTAAWKGSIPDLCKNIEELIVVLKHTENDIASKVNECPHKSIVEYLTDYNMYSGENHLIKCTIPETILLKHYVYFRLALRRLKIMVQGELEGSASDAVQLKYWQEFVEIPWNAYQPTGSFTYNPATQRYGFQEGYDDGDLEDDFLKEPDKEENIDLKKEYLKDKSGEIGVSAEEQTLNSSMTEEEFFTWLKSRGISDEDCNALSENGVTQSGCTQLDAGDFDDLGLTKIGKKLVRKYLKEVPAGERMTFNSFMSKKKFFKWLKSWGVSDKDCNTLSENGVTPPGFTQLDEDDFDDLGLTKIGKKLVLKCLAETKV